MFRFTYLDVLAGKWAKKDGCPHVHFVSPIVFVCDEQTIIQADEKFEQNLGYDPKKAKHIVFTLEELKSEKICKICNVP